MSEALIRLCPACQGENPPDTLRCACGLLLTGIDLSTRRAPPPAAPVPIVPTAATQRCPHDDCQQDNPPGTSDCLYCNRPLRKTRASGETAVPSTLLSLPGALRERYRIVRALPAAGMEADLLIVEPQQGGEHLIAKIYRHGIRPKPEVLERIARIDPRHCIRLFEHGDADGFAYEVMEYCPLGSLREVLREGPLDAARLPPLVAELAGALAALHAAGLIHRDLKPENILMRQREPLDLVLTDFGVASPNDATLRFTSMARSVAYCAPESLSGVIDRKTDYWALGIVVLEAALGRHPFTGLSEAVILHRLTTRGIDLSTVKAPRLRLLLAGLLARDPQARWGETEIARWLRGDQTLAAPRDSGTATPTVAPYRLVDTSCETPQQLAVALATHWQAGVADLENGLLMNWFRQELKDHNLLRFLVELNLDRQLHVDLRLLRLIVRLAPGMTPMWRGEPVDLASVLRRADAALRGDEAAIDWLDGVYRNRVLQAWAEAGNAAAEDLFARWQQSAERFDAAWREALQQLEKHREKGAVANFDELVYGHLSGPSRPAPRLLHARLLALAYDETWGKRLRQRIAGELAALAAQCDWLADLGDPQSIPAHRVLVVEALLPEARKTAKRAEERQAEARDRETTLLATLAGQTAAAIENLRSGCTGARLDDASLRALRSKIDELFDLGIRLRALGEGDASDAARDRKIKLRQVLARSEPVARRLLELIDQLEERRTINAGWINQYTLVSLVLSLMLAPTLLSNRLSTPLIAAAIALLAWRLLPNLSLARRIRRLGQSLARENSL